MTGGEEDDRSGAEGAASAQGEGDPREASGDPPRWSEAEKQLARYEIIMRASRDAIWLFDYRTGETWWNENAYRLYEYDRSIPSKDMHEAWIARIHPDDRGRIRELIAATNAGHADSWDTEYRMQYADGRVAVVEDHGHVERGPAGELLAIVGVATDITKRREAEQGLRESEQRFRQITETITDVFWLTDASASRVLYVSPRYESLWGRTCESVYADPQSFIDAIFEEDRPRVLARVPRQIAGGYDETYRIRRPDGSTAWIRDRAFPIVGPSGEVTAIAGLATDITTLRKLEEQLQQSQKLESIGRLAGGVAHDFNNLLTVILTGVDFALRQASADSKLRADLVQIKEAGQRAANLTAQLLAFARRQVVAPVRIDLNNLTRQMDRLLRRVIGEHIELVTLLAEGLGIVWADKGQLEQVVVNLAVNARDAMSDGGKLTLETANVTVDRAYASSHANVEPGDYVMLAVRDDGPGIPPEVLEHVFEPFFTTKAAGRGTGLGLATCYGIVRQAGGHIVVLSEPGRGTTFKILLPRDVSAPPSMPPPPVRSFPGGSETVLFVEDDASVRSVGVRILFEHGYRVLEASGGWEALRIASEHAGPIHLLLTDVVMPLMSGTELARRLRERRPEVKVLFTSGYMEDTIVHHGVVDPNLAFLQKPYVFESLLAKVRAVLDTE